VTPFLADQSPATGDCEFRIGKDVGTSRNAKGRGTEAPVEEKKGIREKSGHVKLKVGAD